MSGNLEESNQSFLNIPEDIHYECTGCGKCCSGWAVPLTEEDYNRLIAIDWGSVNPEWQNQKLFRSLPAAQKKDTPYTHAINSDENGQCPFLKNNLCFIHSTFGAEVKPAMCKLFPYSFNETPDGVYTTVSFISRGAIANAGRALADQKEYLLAKYQAFKKLFVDYKPDWSQIKLSVNMPISWSEYLQIEKQLLVFIQDKSKNLENRFLEGTNYLTQLLKGKSSSDEVEPNNKLNGADIVLLTILYESYFSTKADRPKGYGQIAVTLPAFVVTIVRKLLVKKLMFSHYVVGDAVLNNIAWPEADVQINDLLYRFFYSHIFAKAYFSAGFGQLTLIAGFNHLAILLALIKWRVKIIAKQRGQSKVDYMDVAETIVQLEKSLGEIKISAYGAAMLELLLASKQRVSRILNLACQAQP